MSESHAIALLREQLGEALPNPETMSLLKSIWPQLSPENKSSLLEPLGHPSEGELVAWRDDDQTRLRLLRQWRWLAGISGDLPEPWATAYRHLAEQFGEGDPDARLQYSSQVQVGSTSPLDAEDIAHLGPERFVEWLQTWEPPPDRWRAPTPGGLASRLQEAIAGNPDPWLAALPGLIEDLHHPTYIKGLLRGLREALAETEWSIDWASLLLACELVVSEPWPVEVLTEDAFDADRDWGECQREVMRLLQRALARDAVLNDEQLQQIWQLLVRLLEMRRDEPSHVLSDGVDLVMLAINKDSTVAIETMFHLALSASRREMDETDWGRRLIEVVAEELDHGGSEAILAGTITAMLFPQLVHLGGDDSLALIPILFGNPTPNEVSVQLLEVLVEHARPITNELLARFYPYLVTYLKAVAPEEGEAERSLVRWLLIGYIRQLPNQDNASRLVASLGDASRISEAAEFYGRVLRQEAQGTAEELRAALAFWDEVLGVERPTDALSGFGWWSEGDAIPDPEWLPRIVATLRRTNGQLDWGDQVVSRLSRLPESPAAWEGLALLVRGAEERWTVAYWAGDLQKLLEATAESPEPIRTARNDFVEALVERELLDFRRYREEV